MTFRILSFRILVLAGILFAAGGHAPAMGQGAASDVLPLSGADWRIREDAEGRGVEERWFDAETSGSDWIPATVPGNIHADLEAARLIPPYWMERDDPRLAPERQQNWLKLSAFTVPGGDPRLADVARKDWWYRKDIAVPASFRDKRVRLVFDGVDHECEVWVNGTRVGGHAGMYRQVGYDVGALLKPGEVNRIGVWIARIPPSLDEVIGTPAQIKAYRHALGEIKSPSYGLDWGQGVYALGLWRGLRLEASGWARIEYVQVQTRMEAPHARAAVVGRLEVDSSEARAARGRFRIEGHGATAGTEVGVELTKGPNWIEATLDLENPALWWPAGQGDQPLYRLVSELLDAEGTLLHRRETRFGVRDLKWVAVEDTPADLDERSQLVVNGRKVRLMGVNFIPVDMLPGRGHGKADWLLRQAHAMGANMVRIWACVPLRDEWYDLADELGIMVQQEMPDTNSGEPWPEEYAEFTAAMERTTISLIKQLRNHPCIVEWTGGNEMGWPDFASPVPAMLARVFAELDDRVFRFTCPLHHAGWRHGPYNHAPAVFYRTYNGPPATRRGEFAAPSPAHIETWQGDIPPASQWPIREEDPVLIAKKVIHAWAEGTWLQPQVIAAEFGALPDLPALIRAGQWIGADQCRYAMDAMRRAGLRTSGFSAWVFNEPWRNGAGNMYVDYDGRPLMNHHFSRQALAPVSLSLRHDGLRYAPETGMEAEVFLVSDAPARAEGLRWSWRARDRRGRVFAQDEGTASVEPLDVQSQGKVVLRPPSQTVLGPVFMEMRLEDAGGRLLTERLHIFSAAGLAAPFAGLVVNGGEDADDDGVARSPAEVHVEFPAAEAKFVRLVRRTVVQVRAAPMRVDGDEEVLELTVKNTGDMTALFCEPHPLIEYRTDLLIDNSHCFIPPGESRIMTIRANRGRTDAKDGHGGLTLEQTGWRISCWNADDVTVRPHESVLLAVGRRDGMCREFMEETRSHGTVGPHILEAGHHAAFEFKATRGQARWPARLRIHASDQSKDVAADIEVTVNGKRFQQSLPIGLGVQDAVPARLAFATTAEFELPEGVVRSGGNELKIRVPNSGWFTWDALDLVSGEPSR